MKRAIMILVVLAMAGCMAPETPVNPFLGTWHFEFIGVIDFSFAADLTCQAISNMQPTYRSGTYAYTDTTLDISWFDGEMMSLTWIDNGDGSMTWTPTTGMPIRVVKMP